MKHLAVIALLLWPSLAIADELAPAEPEPAALQPLGEVSAEFANASVGGQKNNAFEIRRAEFGLMRRGPHLLGGEIILEAIRSAGTQSFSGIDGDSLLMRLKRAWGYARQDVGPVVVEGRFGLLPTPWVEATEDDSRLRYLEQLTAERLGMYFTTDLGAVASVTALGGRLQVQAGVFNGEGRNQTEQNNGKNTQLLISGTAVEHDIAGEPLRLRLYAGGQEGSFGPSAAAAHRLSVGISALHHNLSAGSELHHAYGVGDVSSRDSRGLGLWMRARWKALNVLFRYDNHREDLQREETSSHLLLGGLFGEREIDSSLVRLGLAGRYEKADTNASPLPGLASAGTIKSVLLMFSARFGRWP